jgi:hypothetical protein
MVFKNCHHPISQGSPRIRISGTARLRFWEQSHHLPDKLGCQESFASDWERLGTDLKVAVGEAGMLGTRVGTDCSNCDFGSLVRDGHGGLCDRFRALGHFQASLCDARCGGC